LEAALMRYIDQRNENPKPFNWVRSADEILDAVKRFCLQIAPENSGAYL